MEEKNTGKTVLIVILLLAVVSLGGYIAYDKFVVKDQTAELENKVKTLNSEIKELKSQTTTEESTTEKQNEATNYIDAVYIGGTDDNSEMSEVILFSDGKCISLHIGGEYNLGTYKIENNQLLLTIHVYDETVTEVYNISSDYKTIKHSQGSYSLNKINE